MSEDRGIDAEADEDGGRGDSGINGITYETINPVESHRESDKD